jgi:hypothetical protein
MPRTWVPRLTGHSIKSLYRPSIVALLYYAIYLAWLLSSYENDATVFAYIGTIFADRRGSVPEIVREIGFGPPYWRAGFDGQFYYYIALDPFNAWQVLDTVARYQRILYPLIVRSLSFGILPLIPYLMVAVNLAFVAIGTEFLARFLKLHQINPWYSIGYAFYIGQLVCLRRDLPEPIMCAFVLAAIYIVETRGLTPLAGLFFSLALFTKETAMLFIAPYLLWLLVSIRQSKIKAVTFATMIILPYSLFQLLLFYRFGLVPFFGVGNLQTLTWIPFYGVVQIPRPFLELVSMTIMIVIPAVGALAVFLRATIHKTFHPLVLALLLNGLFLIFLPPPSYLDVFTYARVSLGLAVAWIAYAASTHNRRMLAYSILWTVPFQFEYLQWLL